MTKDGSFKKVVRQHAQDTGQRYTQALIDLQGLGSRMDHEPDAEHLVAHLRHHYGVDAVAATRLSAHKTYVFRIEFERGDPWIARAFPPARPRSGVEGDAAILRFLQRQDYPAERVAAEDPVSDFDGSAVLVTRLVAGGPLPEGAPKFAMMGELLGRLHALPEDESAARPGGASGEDPSREGAPRQDLLAALAFLDAVDTKVAATDRERFEGLRNQVRSADDGHGLPEALLHGNLLHAPDHAILSDEGPVAINWKASGRGPRLADFAYLVWGTGSWNPREANPEWIAAAVNAYRRHIEPSEEELNRLEAVMYIRTLYLVCSATDAPSPAACPTTNGGSSNHPSTTPPPRPQSAPHSTGRTPAPPSSTRSPLGMSPPVSRPVCGAPDRRDGNAAQVEAGRRRRVRRDPRTARRCHWPRRPLCVFAGDDCSMSEVFPEPTAPVTSRAAVFVGYLDFFRSRIIAKVQQLSDVDQRRSVLPSGWTPLELIKHCTFVELCWQEWGFAGRHVMNPWGDQLDGRWYVSPDEAPRTS